jgi:hypothetical protein
MSRTEDTRRFRVRLSVLLPAYLAFGQVCVLVGTAILWATSFEPAGRMVLNTYLAFAALATVAAVGRTAVVAAWHRVEVGPEGIRARPGPIEPIAWEAIQAVRVIRWSVLSYLELETRKGRTHRFPLYLADLLGFADAVEHFAGEDHPLARALWEWAGRESEFE